jgi:hypothetical protein
MHIPERRRSEPSRQIFGKPRIKLSKTFIQIGWMEFEMRAAKEIPD